VELVSAALYKPEELPVVLDGSGVRGFHSALAIALPSVSVAVGTYLLRDYYESIYVFTILFHTIVQAFVFFLIAYLLAGTVDASVHKRRPERAGRAQALFRIAVFSLLPLSFSVPVAVIARIIPKPIFVALPGVLILYFWSIMTLLKGIQFLYEMPLKDMLSSVAVALGAIIGLPVALFVLIMVRLVSVL